MTYDVFFGLWNRSRKVSVHTRADDYQSIRFFDAATITKITMMQTRPTTTVWVNFIQNKVPQSTNHTRKTSRYLFVIAVRQGVHLKKTKNLVLYNPGLGQHSLNTKDLARRKVVNTIMVINIHENSCSSHVIFP